MSLLRNKREEIFSDPQVINNQTVINTKKDGEDLLKGPKPPANFLDNHCEEPKFMPALGQRFCKNMDFLMRKLIN